MRIDKGKVAPYIRYRMVFYYMVWEAQNESMDHDSKRADKQSGDAMSAIIAIPLSVGLGLIALLHLYWAFGGNWPAPDRARLPSMVVGQKGLTHMPPVAITLIVASLIFLAAMVPLLWVFGLGPQPLWQGGLAALGLVFLLRGAVGLTPWFQKFLGEEPFATLNRRYYSPLCLLFAVGFGLLLAFPPSP